MSFLHLKSLKNRKMAMHYRLSNIRQGINENRIYVNCNQIKSRNYRNFSALNKLI